MSRPSEWLDADKIVLEERREDCDILRSSLDFLLLKVNLYEIEPPTEGVLHREDEPFEVAKKDSIGPAMNFVEESLPRALAPRVL